MDVATLAELLRETSEHHDQYEKTHVEHHWWDWYASYLNAVKTESTAKNIKTRRSVMLNRMGL